MDEREVAIVAQVAAKAATEIVSTHAAWDFELNSAIWTQWYTHIGQAIIGTVKRSVVSPPPQSPQTPQGTPTAASNGAAAPQCPQHGLMIAVAQASGKNRPLWKCNQAKWDRNTQQDIGCTYKIWPADESVSS